MTTSKKYLRGAVVLGLLALSAFVAPARAGVGTSQGCSDGIFGAPGAEIPILTSPVTVALEVGRLTGSSPYVQICFSTTATGNGSPAIAGGYAVVNLDPTNPRLTCTKDSSPIVLGVDCELYDDNPASPGRRLDINIWLQGSPVNVGIGAEVGAPGPGPACLRGLTVTVGGTTQGPFNVGICT